MSVLGHLAHAVGYGLAGRAALAFQRHRDQRKIRSLTHGANELLAPPLVSTARMKELMSRHYLEGRYANGVKKVAWVTSGAPTEVLVALGYFVVYPENHAALCGARRKAEELSQVAEEAGYSRDLCSYARTDIGAALSGKTPVGKLPRPDLLLCCNNICQTVLHWYRVLQAHFDVPLVVIDTPFLYQDAQSHQVDYVKQQLEDLVTTAEKIAGRSLSWSRFQQVVRRGKDAAELWLEILHRARTRPSPITAFDGFINMGPIVDLRGEQKTVAFYRSLLAEIEERIQKGVAAVQGEEYRVLWDNLPIWPRIGWLARMLSEMRINVVASTYTYAWGELAPLMDESRPLESAARVYLHPILNRSTGDKLRHMAEMVESFDLQGVILHSDRSCKPYSLGQIDQRDKLASQLGKAALLLEADHNDPRSFSEEQARSRLEAFGENLEALS